MANTLEALINDKTLIHDLADGQSQLLSDPVDTMWEAYLKLANNGDERWDKESVRIARLGAFIGLISELPVSQVASDMTEHFAYSREKIDRALEIAGRFDWVIAVEDDNDALKDDNSLSIAA